MRTKQENTTKELEAVLSTLEPVLAEELFQSFHLLDPLQYARLLYSLDLPDEVYGALLAARVDAPPSYDGPDLSKLVEIAAQKLWERLAIAAATVDATI